MSRLKPWTLSFGGSAGCQVLTLRPRGQGFEIQGLKFGEARKGIQVWILVAGFGGVGS